MAQPEAESEHEHASKQGGARVRFPPPLVFVGLIGLGALVQRFVGPLALPLPSLWRELAGGLCLVGGVTLGVAANLLFKRSGQSPVPWKPSPELVVQGIYHFTRNPMYVGMTLVQLGVGLLLDDGWILALAFVALAVVHVIAVRPEERYLTERFGDSYVQYLARVRRYL